MVTRRKTPEKARGGFCHDAMLGGARWRAIFIHRRLAGRVGFMPFAYFSILRVDNWEAWKRLQIHVCDSEVFTFEM